MSAFFLKHPTEADLALFAGGELGVLSRWRIERHLERCDRCGKEVADFFHLQEDVAELAELPPVDWNALAESIERRVAAEAPRVVDRERSWVQRPLVWQTGLASACLLAGLFVVREGAVFAPQSEETGKMAKLEALAEAPPQSQMLFDVAESDEVADAAAPSGRIAPPVALALTSETIVVERALLKEKLEPEPSRADLRAEAKKDSDVAKAKRLSDVSLDVVEPVVVAAATDSFSAVGRATDQAEAPGRRSRAVGGSAPAAAFRAEARQVAAAPAAPAAVMTPAFQEGEITVEGWILTPSFDDETGLVTLTHVY